MLATVKNNYTKPATAAKNGKMPKMDVPKPGNAAASVNRPKNKQADGRPKAY